MLGLIDLDEWALEWPQFLLIRILGSGLLIEEAISCIHVIIIDEKLLV